MQSVHEIVKVYQDQKYEELKSNEVQKIQDFNAPHTRHQGDLIFVALEKLPQKLVKAQTNQLAEGNTQGSRHVAEVGEVYDADVRWIAGELKRIYKLNISVGLIGPVIKPVDGKVYISHPEHGHLDFCGGTKDAISPMVVVFQRTQDAQARERRVLD